MKKGYLFISNGRKDSIRELSTKPVKTGSFEASSFYAANQMGWKLFMGINRIHAEQIKNTEYDITYYNQHIYRNIFDFKNNWIAYKNLTHFLKKHPEIDIIHCNTPIGGVLGRICGHKFGKKVIYTAHGFHFYKGAPLVNRTIFKWLEQLMAQYTDVLITINQEDYAAAKSMRLKDGGKAVYVPGVGINLEPILNATVNIEDKKKELNLPVDSKIGIVVGDLNDNKNVETIVKAVALMRNPIHILLCGTGSNEMKLKELSYNLRIENYIHFLGYRNDVRELLKVSDLFIMASKREGLPRSTMEAMAAGLPCVVSRIRGNIDLIDDERGGFLVPPMDANGFAKAIDIICETPKKMGEYNKNKVKQFSIEIVNQKMLEIFKSL